MKGALGIFGLVFVLFTILVVGPFVKSFTEGFSSRPEAAAVQEASSQQAEEVKKIGGEIVALNKLLENPTLDDSTREKIVKQKDELQEKITKMTTVELPPADVQKPKEGFQPFVPSSLEAFETFR
jgi:hypothetical protein